MRIWPPLLVCPPKSTVVLPSFKDVMVCPKVARLTDSLSSPTFFLKFGDPPWNFLILEVNFFSVFGDTKIWFFFWVENDGCCFSHFLAISDKVNLGSLYFWLMQAEFSIDSGSGSSFRSESWLALFSIWFICDKLEAFRNWLIWLRLFFVWVLF